jgi:hypothetical protein
MPSPGLLHRQVGARIVEDLPGQEDLPGPERHLRLVR